MRIIDEIDTTQVQDIWIVIADHLSNYKVKIEFNDGSKKIVDFEPFLRNSNHPSIKKYLENDNFLSFRVVDGNLNWNNYDMIFPIRELYEGEIR